MHLVNISDNITELARSRDLRSYIWLDSYANTDIAVCKAIIIYNSNVWLDVIQSQNL